MSEVRVERRLTAIPAPALDDDLTRTQSGHSTVARSADVTRGQGGITQEPHLDDRRLYIDQDTGRKRGDLRLRWLRSQCRPPARRS
jgi:hypothetical protein